MEQTNSIDGLLILRRKTRAVTEVLRAQMTEYLATLTPLLRPRTVLGDYVQGGAKEVSKRADKAYKELHALYEQVSPSRPYLLDRELKPPLDLGGATLEITPVDYQYSPNDSRGGRSLLVRSPLRWVLTYTGFGLSRLSELLAVRTRSLDEIQRAVLHHLALHVVLNNQPGVLSMLGALHFTVTTGQLPDFGPLPVTYIGSTIGTNRPPDSVLVQSAELSGMDVFEEVVNVDDIQQLQDPLKTRLVDAIGS